ncbi:MAG: tRNA glutamyl-Q(34) synthetase GluQRS [Sulfuricella sp.]|nr:tRNA glutamyl-Q(34) synthetase GluQRS [Sulfuricella sp.]
MPAEKAIRYRGRFAPSPTGPLHFGSLLAAVGSFLEARSRGGEWLVRMEDLDLPRVVPGAADGILRTLEAFGLYWDGPVLVQSARTEAYRAALAELEKLGAVYPCACTRKEIADSALNMKLAKRDLVPLSRPAVVAAQQREPGEDTPCGCRERARGEGSGIDGPVYPGTCRGGLPIGRSARAVRLRTGSGVVEFDDGLQGKVSQNLATEVGDFVVRRADGLFAYQLAVVVDDAEQAVTHVVRGADLLDSTPRQIYLQRLLGLPTPAYLHLPVAVNQRGEKLSKQTLAPAVSADDPVGVLFDVLTFLGQAPPPESREDGLEFLWKWAVAHWRADRLPARRAIHW